jgi:hypothetical protein
VYYYDCWFGIGLNWWTLIEHLKPVLAATLASVYRICVGHDVNLLVNKIIREWHDIRWLLTSIMVGDKESFVWLYLDSALIVHYRPLGHDSGFGIETEPGNGCCYVTWCNLSSKRRFRYLGATGNPPSIEIEYIPWFLLAWQRRSDGHGVIRRQAMHMQTLWPSTKYTAIIFDFALKHFFQCTSVNGYSGCGFSLSIIDHILVPVDMFGFAHS